MAIGQRIRNKNQIRKQIQSNSNSNNVNYLCTRTVRPVRLPNSPASQDHWVSILETTAIKSVYI